MFSGLCGSCPMRGSACRPAGPKSQIGRRVRTAHGLVSWGLRRLGRLQKPCQLGCCFVLRNRLQFLESTGEGVRQAPHRSRLELLMHRLKIQIVHSPCQVLGKPRLLLDERLVDQQLRRSADNCINRHCSTCCFKGPKFRCIRSTQWPGCPPARSAWNASRARECILRCWPSTLCRSPSSTALPSVWIGCSGTSSVCEGRWKRGGSVN